MTIRKKKRVRRPIDIFKPVLAPTRRETKRRHLRRNRAEAREKAHEMDKGRCIWPTCGRFVTLEAAHMHELEWRGRGGDPTDPDVVVTTCGKCHLEIHPRVGGVLKRIEGERRPVSGLRFFERPSGKAPWREVTQQ